MRTPFNPQPRGGGPENSLTRWNDEGDGEILCDYGAAYTFVHFLGDRYGTQAVGELYREPDIGLTGFTSVLERLGAAEDGFALMQDWSAMLALDAALDRGTPLRIGDAQRFRSATLERVDQLGQPGRVQRAGRAAERIGLRSAPRRRRALPRRGGAAEPVVHRGAAEPGRPLVHGAADRLRGERRDGAGDARVASAGGGVAATLSADELKALFDPRVDVVAAIVTFVDRAESLSRGGLHADGQRRHAAGRIAAGSRQPLASGRERGRL